MRLLAGKRPPDLGVKDGKLKPPPATPNCVSSQATGGYHAIAPLAFKGDPRASFKRLKRIVAAMPGATVIKSESTYLYAEFKSKFLGLVYDTEFYLDRKAGVIHVRSASRIGRKDFGVNRKRVEAIRAVFAEKRASG